MALLLAGTGLFLRFSLANDLDASIDRALRVRAGDVAGLVAEDGAGLSQAGQSPLTEAGESFGQVLTREGRVLDATPLLRGRPLVDQALRDRASAGTIIVGRRRIAATEDPVRLLVTPAPGASGRLIVVGTSLEDRDSALRNLTVLLVIGGPVALLLASIAGYLLASAALRPVEEMRARSARISGAGTGERLPVPAARDEIRQLGETLNDMLGRVDRAMARERGFVADASHELRTPLAILKTELELALRGEHDAAELRAAIASAGEETDRLSRLAEDLLIIARFDQGRLPVRREQLDATDVLRAVSARFAGRASGQGRAVGVDAADLPVSADRLRIEQALGNLVENALVHGDGAIVMSARRSADGVELHVLDRGPGLPPGFAPSAFERFSRGDPARGRGGAGLGLAIVRAVARAHGGEAHIANRPEGGADAWLTIPGAG